MCIAKCLAHGICMGTSIITSCLTPCSRLKNGSLRCLCPSPQNLNILPYMANETLKYKVKCLIK